MHRALLLLAAALALAGCAANVTTTKITRSAAGVVEIESGKDVTFTSLSWTEGGTTVKVTGYSSNANVDAINAQRAREEAQFDQAISLVERGISLGAKAAAKGALPIPLGP